MTIAVKEKLFEIAQLYSEPDMTSASNERLSSMDFLALMAFEKAYGHCQPTAYDFGSNCIARYKESYSQNPIAFIERYLGVKNLDSYSSGCAPADDRLRFYQDYAFDMADVSQGFLLSSEEYMYASREGDFKHAIEAVLKKYEPVREVFGQLRPLL